MAEWFLMQSLSSALAKSYGICISPKIWVLLSGILSETLNYEKFRYTTSTVTRVFNLVWLITDISLSHWTTTFTENSISR